MTNTQINVDELLDMFKKADEIAKNDLFVDSERNVYKKSAHPNDWEYDDNFSSLYDYAKCTIDTNMTKYEKIGNYIDLNDPFHFAMNEVVSQIHERVDVGNTFDKFLSKHVGCDLEDYKWKSVQALAYDNSIGVMEADIRELDLRSDNNSQQSVDENTQNSESKPKIQKK